MAGSVYPPGSLTFEGVVQPGGWQLSSYKTIVIPLGALVEILPDADTPHAGKVGVVVNISIGVGIIPTKYQVVGSAGSIELPEHVLRLLNFSAMEDINND